MRQNLRLIGRTFTASLANFGPVISSAADAPRRPNIVVIVADKLGFQGGKELETIYQKWNNELIKPLW